MSASMYVASTAMVCPVGLNAAAACAAKRAGISALDDLPYSDTNGEPIVGSVIPGFDWQLKGSRRLLKMLTLALADLIDGRPGERWEQVPLLVGLAEPGRPGVGAELVTAIVEQVQDALGVRFHPKLSRGFAAGHTAGFEALRAARELFPNGNVAACVVCAVDSLVNATTLLWLDGDYRLKTPTNEDGVIPGEAAAALYVRRQATSNTGAALHLIGLGFGFEKANVLSEEPLLGKGLAQAARGALAEAQFGMHEIDFRLSDVTGESYGFKEQTLALANVMRVVRSELPIWHWADSIGDTGAVAGLCQLVIAFHAWEKKYAPGNRAICFTSAFAGQRAVAVIQHQTA